MKTLRNFIKAHESWVIWTLAALLVLLKAMYPLFNKALPATFIFSTFVDDLIPFQPVWIVPYVLWYLYLPGVLILLLRRDRNACMTGLLAQIIGITICYIIYSIFQTEVIRPAIPGTDVFSRMVRLIYSIDNPYNAFPSIHVLGASILTLSVIRARGIGKGTSLVCLVLGGLIIFSTAFVKQHVVLDILAGLALAAGSYFVCNKAVNSLTAGAESLHPG